ncbi:MAG: DUF4838 domain-containing protein [Candidatus Brocadiaceae bacterium]|nr:DUF4838 domain-containing protein [Candidatus Brocadiaceae bacterium]
MTARGVDLWDVWEWDVVVAPDATPAEQYAAEEFRDHFRRATGAALPVVRTAAEGARGHVRIGPGAAGWNAEAFGAEDSRIAAGDGRIAIAGGRPRGTLYGVYTFLEDCLGVRFLTADHTHVPRLSGPCLVGPLERTVRPRLSFRCPYYGENTADPAFAARLRVNTVTDDARLGGRDPMTRLTHTFLRQIPSGVHGAAHPEYYALRDGVRLAPFEDDRYETQPCLSHPDVLRIVTDAVLREIAENPSRGNVSVCQNDNKKHCQCDACRAVDEREGSAMGSLLTFVNAVADAVAARHPHVKVGTFAYQYSRRAPRRLRPRPNVQIQLCSIECCMMHAIDDPDCPRNVEFCRDLADWGRICDDVRIWNYNTNFHNYLLPCPNLRVIEPNVRYFVRNSARGVFMQAAGNARGAELCDLRNYMIAGLLWDPSRGGRELFEEFLELHYAEAAGPIRRFIDLVHDNASARGVHHHCFGRAADYGIDGTIAQAGLDAFDEALALACSDEVRARVEKASIPALRAALEPVWYAGSPEEVDAALAERMRPLARRLLELCARHGVTHAHEYGGIDEARTRLEAVLGLRAG